MLIIIKNCNFILSIIIYQYKNIYIKAIDILFVATEKIIEIIRKQRDKRLQLPDFVRNIQKFHVNNLKI